MNVNFIDYEPPRRFDGEPWNRARIDESTTSTGPWTTIDTKTLSPLDADPENPQSRNFTTNSATLTDGWYRIVFLDADDNEAPATSSVQYVGGLVDQIRPSLHELGELMGARTYRMGKKLGVFTADTSPTAEQADSKIDVATQVVLTKIGSKVTESFYTLCKTAILFKAGALVEMSYFPEQANDDNSAYTLYEDQYNQLMATLVTALSGNTASTPATLVTVPMVGANGYVPLGYNYHYGDVDELLA